MQHHYRIIRILSNFLDNTVEIFGFKFGFDPLIGFIPGIGDVVSLIISFYIIWVAKQMQIPSHEIAMMIRHVVFDFILGLIPFVGDISDFIYRANTKNMRIINKYIPKDTIDAEIINNNS